MNTPKSFKPYQDDNTGREVFRGLVHKETNDEDFESSVEPVRGTSKSSVVKPVESFAHDLIVTGPWCKLNVILVRTEPKTEGSNNAIIAKGKTKRRRLQLNAQKRRKFIRCS